MQTPPSLAFTPTLCAPNLHGLSSKAEGGRNMRMRTIGIALGVLAVGVLAKPDSGWATAITLISSGSGVYDYGLTVTGPGTIRINQNQTITISGLSGVTDASVSDLLSGFGFTLSSFDSTSAVFAETGLRQLQLVPVHSELWWSSPRC